MKLQARTIFKLINGVEICEDFEDIASIEEYQENTDDVVLADDEYKAFSIISGGDHVTIIRSAICYYYIKTREIQGDPIVSNTEDNTKEMINQEIYQ